ncbi:MAG TPA: prolyl oligopeptidase family serine peptidase [Chthoniobacteraceae bacterium]|jgi:dipeptidyl aminopeptidase/acylaminoacyl peptidase|nr:prolyl oligopeptidase family serine peptidase [Chthoniobacteraceae bacterium]
MNIRRIILALIVLAAPLHARVWTLSDQRTFEAEYVSATATHVSVKVKDGRVVPVELTRLSQADRDFIAQQLAANPAPPPAATTPPAAPKPATPAPSLTAGKAAAIKGPYAEYVTGEWKQFEGKGGLQCMLFGAPTLDATKKWPLVIYLHGKGNRVLTREHLGFAAACAKPANYGERPCFIFAPQCPDENGWGGVSGANVLKTVKDLMHQLPIDPDRVYLTGLSMGGFGTFAMLNDEPRLFAAGIPVAGSADVAITRNLRRIPLWIFHGDKDDVVSPEGSRAIAKALEKMKAPTKYTEFPGAGHGIGGKVFDDPEVHKWLFAQKRK